MSALAAFHFLRPFALLLLLALPLFWLAWRSGRSDAGAWRAVVDAHLLPHLIERIDGGRGRAGLILATVLWTLACVALAGPAWERESMPLYHNQAARVIALELASTMLAQDDKPNRLERARYKIDDILARSRDYQTALIGYAGAAFVAAPLTDDTGTVKNLVDALDPSTMPVAGNATGSAIAAAARLIEQAGLHHGQIILLADGADADAVAAARNAYRSGLIVSVLGVGSASGAPVSLAEGGFLKDEQGNVIVSRRDEAGLRAVAEAGGGRYANLSADGSDLDSLLAGQIDPADRGVDMGRADGVAENARWRDRGVWLVLALLPLALLGFRRGWLMVVAFALFTPAVPGRAAALEDLWRRPDQQAASALAHGDAKQAATVARSPEWRGSAAYRAGDYEKAAGDFAQVGGANGAYNRGNALARLGRYEDAIAAYDEALKVAPEMADAKANREAVENFLKKSKPPPQSGQGQQQGSQGQQQQGQPRQGEQGSQQRQGQERDKQDQQGQSGERQSAADDSQDSSSQSGQPQASPQQQGSKDDKPGSTQKPANDAASAAGGTAEAGRQNTPDAEQQKALSQSIDKALAKGKAQPERSAADNKGRAAAPVEDEATREKQQALEHWLRRVPDDPGGLLRRKFQLEYQRRQQGAGVDG